ncbi:MAG: glycosyltransferase family 2 protein [Planctomycetota bacterium]|nr:glycosyltransferase family 2 protein [Planctomycetota bacterium]
MSESTASISVIVPLYNELDSVRELHRRLREALGETCEIIYVDDGSDDGTRECLVDVTRRDPEARVIGFRRNHGKSHALEAGFRRARGEILVTIDGDLQDDPGEIPQLLRQLRSGYDLVGGCRRDRRDAMGKVLGSRLFNALVRLLCRVRFRDINCGLKVSRREVVDEIRLASGYHRFLPLLAHWKGFRVCEVDVRHHPRRHGVSRYGGARIWKGLVDLAVLLFLERLGGRPGRYFAGLGAVMTTAGGGVCLYLLCLRLLTGSIQERFPLLSLGLVLLVMGMQLVSLGFFSELLSYLFRSRQPVEPLVWEETREGSGEATERAATDVANLSARDDSP